MTITTPRKCLVVSYRCDLRSDLNTSFHLLSCQMNIMYRHLRYGHEGNKVDTCRRYGQNVTARDVKLGMEIAQVKEVKESTYETRNNLSGQSTPEEWANRMNYYKNVETLNDRMLQIERDAKHKDIDIQEVNKMLQQRSPSNWHVLVLETSRKIQCVKY
ncbi:hypothetical protein Tco_1004139 [Tanacetum coccineum]|uniref:Uncharacterized protein n=1 Tax=Tanacetum coccineum TaxID=301880 RepID=A0ABQ5FB10_9ASTR